MNYELAQYNGVLAFFSASQLDNSTFSAYHRTLMDARDDIHDTLQEAKARIDAIEMDLWRVQARMSKIAATSDPHWYENTDIMCRSLYGTRPLKG